MLTVQIVTFIFHTILAWLSSIVFAAMPHLCTIQSKKFEGERRRFPLFASKWMSLVVITAENPLCSLYFRSETEVRAEKIKQLSSKHRYIIHPLSKFRKWYDICILFIYMIMLIVKPIDCSIGRRQSIGDIFNYYQEFSLALDVISWLNIALQFGMGYSNARNKLIEMRPSKIARYYLCSPYFIGDVLSSIPRYFLYRYGRKMNRRLLKIINGVLNIFCVFKFIRISTVITLISKISYIFHIKSSTAVFLATAITSCFYIMHMSSCLMLAVPKLVRHYLGSSGPKDWLKYWFGVDYKKLYIKAALKSSACLLGIRYDIEKHENIEDYLVTITTYVVGKMFIGITWVVLAISILNSRKMVIKYQELLSQLNEYMIQKQLPLDLRHRILQLYTFKYRKQKYFKEELIDSLLSDTLRKDISRYACRSLIRSVSLFAELPYDQVNNVVSMLVPEIFLPTDVIIQCGNNGKSMYFLSSGTVAVYTRSGKEICHLQDGEYFGEISLVLKGQVRTATITAVEITQVYRLNRKDFEKTLKTNRLVHEKIVRRAEMRLKEILLLEEIYKKNLFEKTYTGDTLSKASMVSVNVHSP